MSEGLYIKAELTFYVSFVSSSAFSKTFAQAAIQSSHRRIEKASISIIESTTSTATLPNRNIDQINRANNTNLETNINFNQQPHTTNPENGHNSSFCVRNSSSNPPLPRSREIRTAPSSPPSPLLPSNPPQQTSTLRSLFAEAHPFARKTAYLKPHSVAWKFYRTKLGRASLMYFPGMTLVLGWPWAAKWMIMKGNGL